MAWAKWERGLQISRRQIVVSLHILRSLGPIVLLVPRNAINQPGCVFNDGHSFPARSNDPSDSSRLTTLHARGLENDLAGPFPRSSNKLLTYVWSEMHVYPLLRTLGTFLGFSVKFIKRRLGRWKGVKPLKGTTWLVGGNKFKVGEEIKLRLCCRRIGWEEFFQNPRGYLLDCWVPSIAV